MAVTKTFIGCESKPLSGVANKTRQQTGYFSLRSSWQPVPLDFSSSRPLRVHEFRPSQNRHNRPDAAGGFRDGRRSHNPGSILLQEVQERIPNGQESPCRPTDRGAMHMHSLLHLRTRLYRGHIQRVQNQPLLLLRATRRLSRQRLAKIRSLKPNRVSDLLIRETIRSPSRSNNSCELQLLVKTIGALRSSRGIDHLVQTALHPLGRPLTANIVQHEKACR